MFAIYLIASFLLFKSKSQTVKTNAGLSCQHGLRPLVDCMQGTTTQQSCEARGCCYRNYGENSIQGNHGAGNLLVLMLIKILMQLTLLIVNIAFQIII